MARFGSKVGRDGSGTSAFLRLVSVPLLGLVGTVTVGIWVNILTTVLSATEGPTWYTAILALPGRHNLLLAVAVVSLALQVALPRKWNRQQEVRLRGLLPGYEHQQLQAMQAVLQVAVHGIRAFRPSVKLNARYFEYRQVGDKDMLVKQPILHAETDPMPREYGLMQANIHEDRLVICKAFLARHPIYEELEPGHVDRYGWRLKPHVDPRQRWVLACPVLSPPSALGLARQPEPKGVIVFFGTEPPASSEEEVNHMMQVSRYVADAFWAEYEQRRTLDEI